MPAYWNQLVGHLSERRSRWMSHRARAGMHSRERSSPMNARDGERASGSPRTPNSSSVDRENENLKRELADLRAQVAQLTQLSQTRADQIDFLVAAMRHLRCEQRRWSSLSSVDGYRYRGASNSSSELSRTLSGCPNSDSDEDDTIDGWLAVFQERRRRENSATTTAKQPVTSELSPTHGRRHPLI